MQGGILGIQAKESTNNTQPTNKKPAIKGGKRKRGRPKHHTLRTTQKKRGEEPGGSRGQMENVTHTHQKGYERALAVSKKGPRIIHG